MAKILLVEDSEDVRVQLRDYLTQQGFDIIEAVDGKQALEICRSTEGIEVIVTDQNMPHVTGLEMLRALRADARYRETTVVFHSTESKAELLAEGHELKIKGWLVKPIHPERLAGLLHRLLGSVVGLAS